MLRTSTEKLAVRLSGELVQRTAMSEGEGREGWDWPSRRASRRGRYTTRLGSDIAASLVAT
jgi:hypothetical protein